jgi:hypothetical protein
MLLKQARSYLAKGVSVFPVGRDKKPLLLSWKEYQTRLPTDEELVKWFSGDANIAIVTGKISNVSVVDVDPRHGGTTKGLPPTLIAKTQSGGWHYYYRYLEGLPNKAGIGEGIDIRSDGGYVVAPPSKGEKGTYEWVLNEEPQPFPADILNVAIGKSQVDWKDIAQGVGEGGRNETAAKFIGKLIATFSPLEWESAVWLTVLNWNRANKPPLPENELRAVFNSVTSREFKKRKEGYIDDVPVVLMSDAVKKFSDDTTVAYPTGFQVLDKALSGGIRDGNLGIVVGLTGHGKTTWARTLTCNMLDRNVTSVWFTFELSIPEMWEKFQEMGMEDGAQVYTPERYVTRKLDWLKKKIVEARDMYKCKVVYIDHLGFLVGDYDGKNIQGMSSNLATVYTMICRDLKSIALQENIIIVLMWHIKKLGAGKKEADEDDVKDSSGVLQECDWAVNVTREKLKSGGSFSTEAVEDIFGPYSYIKMLKNRRTGDVKRFKCVFQNGRLMDDSDTVNKMFNKLEDNDNW